MNWKRFAQSSLEMYGWEIDVPTKTTKQHSEMILNCYSRNCQKQQWQRKFFATMTHNVRSPFIPDRQEPTAKMFRMVKTWTMCTAWLLGFCSTHWAIASFPNFATRCALHCRLLPCCIMNQKIKQGSGS